MSHLGEYLKQLRGELSIYEVGQATGIARGDLSRYERGVLLPTKEKLKKLAEFFEVPYKELRTQYYKDYLADPEEYQIVKDWVISSTK